MLRLVESIKLVSTFTDNQMCCCLQRSDAITASLNFPLSENFGNSVVAVPVYLILRIPPIMGSRAAKQLRLLVNETGFWGLQ